jgi:hypothetical protein
MSNNIIQVFEQEKSIAELIQKQTSIAYECNIKPSSVKDLSVNEKEEASVKACVNSGQPDLYYLEAVLVSTNWNGNDDVFAKEETWQAKSSPVNKMFNYMHDESDVIGHITSSYVTVNDEVYASEDTIPDFFDIVVGSVLYKKWSDPKRQERMDRIIAEIPEGKWFVSMEALFAGFDYAIISNNDTSSAKIISRNNETAFLSKHLRAYGGTGVYNDHRIGRVLKNITFSGKGLVDRPANKRSLIKSYSFNGTFASLNETFGSILMSDTVSKQDYEKVKAELDVLKQDIDKSKAEKIQTYEATIASLNEKNEALASEKAALESKLSNAEALSSERAEKIETIEAAMKEKDGKMDEMKKDMEKMKKEKAKSSRVSQLTSVGVDSAKAEEIAEKFTTADDSMFSEVVALYDGKMKDEKKKKEDESKAGQEDEADASELDNVTQESSANLNQDSSEDKSEQLRAKASAWLSESFK